MDLLYMEANMAEELEAVVEVVPRSNDQALAILNYVEVATLYLLIHN